MTKMSELETVNMKEDDRYCGDICEDCEQLAMTDRNVFKRRRTRRGRRKPYKTGKGFDSHDDQLVQREMMKQTGRGRHGKILRTPVSPKAPMNSTQFLIEDRCGYMTFNEWSYVGLQSPDQMLSNSPHTPDHDTSFYKDRAGDGKLKTVDMTCSEDTEYLALEETYDFIGREFEREFAECQFSSEMDNRLSMKNKLINESTKQEIIEKFITLENRLKEVFNEDVFSNTSQSLIKNSELSTEIKQLKRENATLKEENELLKTLIS